MEQAKVLMIYTGGTIGMIEEPETGTLIAFDFEHLSEQIPELSRIDVELKAVSIRFPIDSSDMNPMVWQEIAQHIVNNYETYNGFVILHGSDTMAYTASALSFMLQGLKKPVILTGSQLPIGKIRTDGKENLITSIEIAAQMKEDGSSLVQEVAIYFEDYLYRGNRTIKVSANAFEAFRSPNYLNLAFAGIDIKFNLDALYSNTLNELVYKHKMDDKVALMKIFPGFAPPIYQSLFEINRVKAVILETFGAGNPPNNSTLFEMIENYIQSGGIVVNITQCSSGTVIHGKYANSATLHKIGVISGRDLTTEAAITKIMFLLGNYSDTEEIKRLMQTNLVGEMSE